MICKDEGVILKSFDFRETSKIVTFFSRQHGKVSGVLKGIRKDPRKFGSNLDFLSINDFVFYKKRFSELHLISQCDLRKQFTNIKGDMVKFSVASFCAEFLLAIMPVEHEQKEVYDLLVEFLNDFDVSVQPQKLFYNFILKTLSLSGFQPHLESCVVCKVPLKSHSFFSSRFGGILCQRCSSKDPTSETILPGTISTILHFQHTAWRDSLKLSIFPAVESQLKTILFAFLHFHLEKRFRSMKTLIEALRSTEK